MSLGPKDSKRQHGWLLITEHPDLIQKQYPIRQITVIGRDISCDISILEGFISRRHVSLIPQNDSLIVKDLGSTNGTFINGKKIIEARAYANDELRIDKFDFIIQPIADFMQDQTQSREQDDVTRTMFQRNKANNADISPSIIQDRSALVSLLSERHKLAQPPNNNQIGDLPCLVVIEGHQFISRSYYLLTAPKMTIGKSNDNDIVIDNDTVSAKHTELELRDDQWWLLDSQSINGTQVNNQAIKEHSLTSKDEIKIGNIVFRFQHSPTDEASLSSIMSLTQSRSNKRSPSTRSPYTILMAVLSIALIIGGYLFFY